MFSPLPAPRLPDRFRCDNGQPIPTSGKAVRKRKKLVPDNVPSLIRKVTMGLLSPWEAWLKPPMLAWSGFALVLTDYLLIVKEKIYSFTTP